jgi:hypothetical protein
MSWQLLNLAKLDARPPVRPTIGEAGLVYPGRRHVFSGLPESAKTIAAYIILIEEARKVDGPVILIDFEMGPYEARDRLRELGATDDDLERIVYVEPDSAASEETIQELVDLEPTLMVVDAAAGAYALEGLDDNKRADVERFAGLYVDRFWRNGTATIVIDHVVKDAKSRGMFTIGSERKTGGADVHFSFETKVPIRRGSRGVYKIHVRKDRFGCLTRPTVGELELRSDPDTHQIAWTFTPTETDSEERHWQPTRLMEKVSRYLERPRPEDGDGVSQTKVEENVTGRAEYVRTALDELVRQRYAEKTAGTRGSQRFRSIKPFREDDPVPPRPDPVPDGVESGSATPSRPGGFYTPGRGRNGRTDVDELNPVPSSMWVCTTCGDRDPNPTRKHGLAYCACGGQRVPEGVTS